MNTIPENRLVVGRYYWASWVRHPDDPVFIVQCNDSVRDIFSMCGSDENIHWDEVKILKEVDLYD